ncbi:anti-sigma factor family protein [Umezawaea endophytica]|uniref:Zf-HC2 domain-containing protein n=1 Tax=Umezawaea endophytica TaxID=1654476 RepID=A0A9X2VS76_9PSEU|nr:zf-HC2 domain-containing protein [Umezawaea endophytica]MCS7481392.1 zf-HC2 domain-containing protein [Umezawaea endophytica]
MSREEHRATREQLGAYVLEQLADDERIAVRAHLDGCALCRAELVELEPVVVRLGEVDADRLTDRPAVPPGLGDLVVSRLMVEQRRRWRPPRWVGVAAAAVLIAAVGAFAGWFASESGRPSVPVESVAVGQAAPGVSASAALVPHTWGVEIKLTAAGFGEGTPYRVVVVDRQGHDVGAGEFVGTGAAEMRCNLNSSVLRGNAAGFKVLDPSGVVALSSSF